MANTSITAQLAGNLYTDGIRLPDWTKEVTGAHTWVDTPTKTVTVATRPYRIDTDGVDFLASTTSATRPEWYTRI